MNVKIKKDNNFDDCERISTPTHRHLQELLSILSKFHQWREDVGEFKNRFIPYQSFEDITWIIFGVVDVSVKYLNAEKSNILAQDEFGSDDTEHHFSNTWTRNPSANILDCKQASSYATASRSHTF